MEESDIRDAVCFRPRFLPDLDTKPRTYFGGRPTFAAGMSWPEIAVQGRKFALTFLGQVDLADVARAARLPGLPDRGVLYFFLDTCIIMDGGLEDGELEGGMPWRVLFSGPNAWHFKESGVPKNLMPCFGEAYEGRQLSYSGPPVERKWTSRINWRDRYYCFESPKIPMAAVVTTSFLNSQGLEVALSQLEAWKKAFGEPVLHIIRPEHAAPSHELWTPSENFPETNIYLEIASAGIVRMILGPREDALLARIGQTAAAELRKLVGMVHSHNLFSPTSRDQRQQFWTTINQLAASDKGAPYKVNEAFWDAYYWGTVFSLANSRASTQPASKEMADLVRSSFAPLRDERSRKTRI